MKKPVIKVLKSGGEIFIPTDRVSNGKLHQDKLDYKEDGTAALQYDLGDYEFKNNDFKSQFNNLARKIINEHPKAPYDFDEKERKKLQKKFEDILNEWIYQNKIVESIRRDS